MALCWWWPCPVSCARRAMQEALWWEKQSAEERLLLGPVKQHGFQSNIWFGSFQICVISRIPFQNHFN